MPINSIDLEHKILLFRWHKALSTLKQAKQKDTRTWDKLWKSRLSIFKKAKKGSYDQITDSDIKRDALFKANWIAARKAVGIYEHRYINTSKALDAYRANRKQIEEGIKG